MRTETKILCASANALASAALLGGLITALVQRGILTAEDEQSVYDNAIETLEGNADDDPDGIFELAFDILEQQRAASIQAADPVNLVLVKT